METSADSQHPQYLKPSELGTKDYWETYYKRSLEHIATKAKTNPTPDTTNDFIDQQEQNEDDDEEAGEEDDDDDPGTSWFSEHDAPGKVLRYMTSRRFPLSPRNNRNRTRDQEPSILDLGTGNGSMLALLRKRGGFRGMMVGVDYSAQSVQLARELQRLKLHSAYESGEEEEEEEEEEDAEGEGEGEGEGEDDEHEDVVVARTTDDNSTQHEEGISMQEQDIRFEEWDILDPANEEILSDNEKRKVSWFPYDSRGFDVVLDKGTFDAVSLSDETSSSPSISRTHICHQYPIVAAKLVRPGGYLIVTSCNWTEDELVHWFTATPGKELEVQHRLEYPRFRFGGQEGQGVCTVCFKRKPALTP